MKTLTQPHGVPNTGTMPKTIATQLREWRATAGLSQSGAAAALGVPVRSIENWEQGVSEPLGLARTALFHVFRTSGHPPEKKSKKLESSPQVGESIPVVRAKSKATKGRK